jgi:hypothetical protein
MKTRRVTVYKWQYNDKGSRRKSIVGDGTFHQFGTDYADFESGPCAFTTAIVEMLDGSVMNVPVEMIVFANPGETNAN